MKTLRKRFIPFASLLSLIAVSCTEEPSQPVVVMGAVTGAASHISCRNAEISGKANLPNTASADLAFGILYSTSSGVLFGKSIQLEANTFDSEYNYSVDTEVLEPETTYYYRAYISQNGEITYGEVKSFETLAVSSMIQTLDAADINPKDAVLNASLDLTDCIYDSIEYGFEVTPEGEIAFLIGSDNLSDKAFSVNAKYLSGDTNYSIVAYVILDGCTYHGEATSFITPSIEDSDTDDNYVYDFVINQRDWKLVADANHPDEKFYECTIKVDGLTEECYNFGQVCLYQDFDGYQQKLPVTRHRNDGEFVWTETTDCTFTVGSVTIYFTSNGFAEVLPDSMYFRAVLTYEKTK